MHLHPIHVRLLAGFEGVFTHPQNQLLTLRELDANVLYYINT